VKRNFKSLMLKQWFQLSYATSTNNLGKLQ
jgi:hypothetical protein